MAPPPEYDKEPKAPDKSATNISSDDTKALQNLVNDLQSISDNKPTSTVANNKVENNKHVETLDDVQLRALLDEAIAYKRPKDRVGKSSLFKELLEEVELDDQEVGEAAARSFSGGRTTHSNSLQNLFAAAALAAEPRRTRHHTPAPTPAPVSTRAIHGGSLPSGVDTSSLLCEEPAEYVATVRCFNPSPLSERSDTLHETDPLNRRTKPMYTARATLEIGSGSVCSGRAVTTTTASNQIDSAISFSCITTPEVVSSCNTTSSTSQAAVAVDPKPRSVISSSFNGLPLSRPNYGSTGTTAPEEYKKSLDENGNSVQGYSSSSVSGSSSQHKKPRRKKSSKNESVIESQNIDGYQGNKDLNEVLRFIESNADNGRAQKLGRAKHRDDVDDKGAKKRSTERRKDKENKIKRATSLEELSRTKLEDLTDKPEPTLRKNKKERWTDGESAAKAERRSWGDDAREFYNPDNTEAAAVELTDFQTVTKKRKPRRRTDETEKETVGDPTPRRNRVPSPRPRRESAPPSDRSNDSNDDMDSVHSLPAPAPTAHHASYADIARTRHNIPDLIESCNFYAENAITVTPTAPSAGDADGYPALERATPARRRDKPQGSTTRRERKERGDCPAPDVVADRPPVVLLDSSVKPRDMDGVTFGFDINEQLLSGSVRKPRCDLVRDTIAAGVSVRAGCGSVRYMPPTAPTDMHLLHQLVDYVGSAWEDIMRCGGGKVRYYTD